MPSLKICANQTHHTLTQEKLCFDWQYDRLICLAFGWHVWISAPRILHHQLCVRIGWLFRCLGFPKLYSAPNSSLIVNNKMNYKTLINCFDWCLPFVLFWRDHTDQAEGRELILRRSVTGRLTDCVPLWSNSYLLNTGDILKYFEVSVKIMSDDVPYWKYFVDWVLFIQYMRLS